MSKELSKNGSDICTTKLSQLAESINTKHRFLQTASNRAIKLWLAIGEELFEAKQHFTKGSGLRWGKWVEENCPFNRWQAWKYIYAYQTLKTSTPSRQISSLNELVKASENVPAEPTEESEESSNSSENGTADSGATSDTESEPEPEPWTRSELQRKKTVEAGHAVMVNMHGDPRLIAWAKENGLFVQVDRRTKWGNPFEIPGDGDRDDVIEAFEVYMQYKRSLEPAELAGKVLGCWCYPEACHGDVLIRLAHCEHAEDEACRVGCHR